MYSIIIIYFRNIDSNGSLMLNEFAIEKEYLTESIRPFDDHILLKDYYKEFSNQTNLVNYSLIENLIVKILDLNFEGKKFKKYKAERDHRKLNFILVEI